ncbi:MAG: hypothetical protein WCY60_07260, partial [Trueperaceae bacterium]
ERETIDGKLIHKAHQMALEGKGVAEIKEWIVASAVASERRVQELEEREKQAVQEREKAAAEQGRHGPLEPRPEPRPVGESGD